MMTSETKRSSSVAIIVRTKDRPLFLERAIKDITAQTYKDFVIVLINDGGDPAQINKLVKKYDKAINGRLQIIHNQKSMGMQAASNKGIKNSRSEYIVIHDDDDTWHPEFLAQTTARLESTNAMGVIATTDLVTEKIQKGKIETLESRKLYPGLKYINLYKMCFENYAAPISFLYRREALSKIGYYDESLGGVADWDFGLRFLLHYEIEYLETERSLAFYYHRPQATGINANSVYTNTHMMFENLMFNKYLRSDINKGELGLGYLVGSLRKNYEDQQTMLAAEKKELDQKLQPIFESIAQINQKLVQLEAINRNNHNFIRRAANKIRRR